MTSHDAARWHLPDLTVHLRSRLALPVLLVGVGSGLLGAAYVGALRVLQHWLWPDGHTAALQAGLLVGAGLVVGVGVKLFGPTGDVELLVDNIHVLGGAAETRRTIALVPISLVCVATGGGMGPEAPLVQTTGTFGSWVAGRRGLTRSDLRILTITGMAAGFTVLFGAPLGAALFALEILHKRGLQYYEALLPAIIGSLAGFAVYTALTGVGLEPVWSFPAPGALTVTDLGWALAIGVLGAAGASLFTVLAAVLRRGFARLPAVARPVLGGVALGLLGWWSPYALTFGEGQVAELTATKLAAGALLVAAVAKLCGTLVTLASGWKGGFIIPLFFMGAATGQAIHAVLPSTNASIVMACLMVALCVGVTKTPLGSTLVVTEMAGLPLLPMVLVAAVVSLLLTSSVGLIDSQRERPDLPRADPAAA